MKWKYMRQALCSADFLVIFLIFKIKNTNQCLLAVDGCEIKSKCEQVNT